MPPDGPCPGPREAETRLPGPAQPRRAQRPGQDAGPGRADGRGKRCAVAVTLNPRPAGAADRAGANWRGPGSSLSDSEPCEAATPERRAVPRKALTLCAGRRAQRPDCGRRRAPGARRGGPGAAPAPDAERAAGPGPGYAPAATARRSHPSSPAAAPGPSKKGPPPGPRARAESQVRSNQSAPAPAAGSFSTAQHPPAAVSAPGSEP